MPRQERARLNHTPMVSPVDMAKRFANQIHPREKPQDKPDVYLRQGEIVSVQTATVTITLGGDTVPIVGVPVVGSYVPTIGDGVQVLETSAGDLLVLSRSNPTVRTWPVSSQILEDTASSALTLTTTITSIPGISIPFNTTLANALVIAFCTFDCDVSLATNTLLNGYVQLDAGTNVLVAADDMNWVHRYTKSGHKIYVVATPGAHTMVMRGNKNFASGTALFNTVSRLSLLVIG